MNNSSSALAVEKALSPGVIACVAGVWWAGEHYCLPITTAANVIRHSGSRVLVVHASNPKKSNNYQTETLDFSELLRELQVPISNYSFFFNTSLCSKLEDVLQLIDVMENLRTIEPFSGAASIFLKLEILDKNLHPKDHKTCDVLDKLSPQICEICIPFLSGELEPLKHAANRGCPAIRIWGSEIGQRSGIKNEQKLRHVVKSINIPLILEGGLATPEDVQKALKLGFKAVLMNSAFRYSEDPVKLAEDIRIAIDSVRV